ncbi:L,D-transpeptidase [Microcoleus vaginatus]|uniref:L,D-transpeptidase n=1 Tax=Microcoleus vaginatus TaxID=119532 RepID=UPI00403FA93B
MQPRCRSAYSSRRRPKWWLIQVIVRSQRSGPHPRQNCRISEPQKLPPLGEPFRYIPQEPKPAVNPIEEVRLVLKLRERRVYVYRQNKVQASFPVAVGKGGWETPTGNFKVMQMIKDPVWQNPWTGELIPAGPDNPLGSRWMGFWTDGKNVIGFHGTPNPESIGGAASHGCVRMFDKDAQALFEKVAVGTPVIVEH